MKLDEIVMELGSLVLDKTGIGQSLEITGVTHNSNWVQPGNIFVAIKGEKRDAHDFIPDAVDRGAVAIVGRGYDASTNLAQPYITVADDRKALAQISSILEGRPSESLSVIGITGTKGKTTTTWLTRHLLASDGYKTGMLSTVGYKLADGELHHFPAHFTTPEAPQVQSALRAMVDSGCTHAVIESSSHALQLRRLDAIAFDVAVWTNLSPDHLDFHGSMQEYFEAKRILVKAAKYSVINADDPWTARLAGEATLTYSLRGGGNWNARNIATKDGKVVFDVDYPGGTFAAELPMMGTFNVANALGAMAAASLVGLRVSDMPAHLATFGGVPGRMDIIQREPFCVLVDFAHTQDSLISCLQTVREATTGRVIVVIGAAGARDHGRRGSVGRVASELADLAIFTEEDYRDESLDEIMDEMKRGAKAVGKQNFIEVPDRREAIFEAIAGARAGDTVVLAGKGVETTLERGTESVAWDEAGVAREALAQLLER